jgi:beta-phosphoglucomutase-like phosphatase (HAD superfamily)
MFEAVIFDWDGTLADTRQVIVISFQKALSEINCKVSDEYIESRMGIGAAETFREILHTAKFDFDEMLIQELVERKSQLQIELSKNVKLFPGALELLEALQYKAASKLKANPEKSVVFEDSIFGVKAAKSAKMGCVAVTTGVYSRHELEEEKPDLVVKTLSDIKILPFILK